MGRKYDFSGWATKNDLLCSDGRTIIRDAFKDNDGETVPLVWNHQHGGPFSVLGHALLENRNDGVYAYCTFNGTEQGRNAKMLVENGDVKSLSIYANQLKQRGMDVVHGVIREVSLVLAGANPGASIDFQSITHGEGAEEEAVIYTEEEIELFHADEDTKEKENKSVAEDTKAKTTEDRDDDEETIQDVFNTFTDKQKKVCYALVGLALEENKKTDNDEGDEDMKHNVFENDELQGNNYLSHSDIIRIFENGKRCGSLKEAFANAIDDGILAHSIDTTGMDTATGTQTYGFNDPDMLFPNYRTMNNPPEWISREMGWVKVVMNGVHHTPFSRIKSVYANITEDEARAKGYIKGNQKKTEVFTTLKRQTSPQTIYKFQKMDRDDIIDITDFDVVAWIKAEMRVMLNEEIARAILIGDGREPDAEDKINEECVRPIATDVPLFNTKIKVETKAGSTNAEKAKETIDAIIRGRKYYKGTGNPTFFTTEDWLAEFLLLEDGINHKLYKSVDELKLALRVKDIVTVEVMEDQEVDSLPLIGILVNLADYNVGADKGGSVNLFDDFDLEYNKERYLIETRISGALIKPYSALTVLDNEAS